MRRRYVLLGTGVVASATAMVVGLSGLAQADPLNWQQVKVPDLGENGQFNAVDVLAADNVWAVGSFGPKPDRKGLVRNWNGTEWLKAKLPGDSFLTDVRAFAPDDVWVVGEDMSYHYDGEEWTAAKVPVPGDGDPWLKSVDGSAGDDLWAVGNTGSLGGGPDGYAFLEHYDGKEWSKVDIPVPDGVKRFGAWQVNAVAADDVWVVGSLYTDTAEKPLLAHWDGKEWTVEDPKGLPDGAGSAIASLDGEVWMTGYSGDLTNPSDGEPLLLRREKGTWTSQETPKEPAWFYNLTPDGKGGLIAGGHNREGAALLRWDGDKAEIQPGPVKGVDSGVEDLGLVPGTDTVWAIGALSGKPWAAHS